MEGDPIISLDRAFLPSCFLRGMCGIMGRMETIALLVSPVSFVVLVVVLVLVKKGTLRSVRLGKFSADFGRPVKRVKSLGGESGGKLEGTVRIAERSLALITYKMYGTFLGKVKTGDGVCPAEISEAYLYRLLMRDVVQKSLVDIEERIRINGFTQLEPSDYDKYSEAFRKQTMRMWIGYVDENFPAHGKVSKDEVFEMHKGLEEELHGDLGALLNEVRDHLRRIYAEAE